MKAAEWHRFDLGCTHDLDLLPVVDFSHTYRCLKCGGTITVVWTQHTVGMNAEQMREYAEHIIAAKSQQEIPEFTA